MQPLPQYWNYSKSFYILSVPFLRAMMYILLSTSKFHFHRVGECMACYTLHSSEPLHLNLFPFFAYCYFSMFNFQYGAMALFLLPSSVSHPWQEWPPSHFLERACTRKSWPPWLHLLLEHWLETVYFICYLM